GHPAGGGQCHRPRRHRTLRKRACRRPAGRVRRPSQEKTIPVRQGAGDPLRKGASGMNIDELLNMMEEMLEEATGLPFAGGKRVVDADRMQDIIDEVRLNLPTEVRQAKAIVNDRAE